MKCMNCGKEVRDTAVVCGYCGHRLKVEETPAPPEQRTAAPAEKREDRKPLRTLGAVVGIVVVTLVILWRLGIFGFLETYTPLTTATSEPTQSSADEGMEPENLPSPVTDALDDVEVEFHDDFSTGLTEGWYLHENASTSVGQVRLSTEGEWDSYWLNDYEQGEGKAAMISFTYGSDAYFVVGMTHSDYGDEDYLFWGIDASGDRYVNKGGESNIYSLSGNLNMRPDTWYCALFAIGENSDFLTKVWECDNPSVMSQNRYDFSEDWEQKGYRLTVQVRNGIVYLDDFYSLSFAGYR